MQQGQNLAVVLDDINRKLTQEGFTVDYVEARTPMLQSIEQFDQDIVIFVAAKIGKTRLIDNLQIAYSSNHSKT